MTDTWHKTTKDKKDKDFSIFSFSSNIRPQLEPSTFNHQHRNQPSGHLLPTIITISCYSQTKRKTETETRLGTP